MSAFTHVAPCRMETGGPRVDTVLGTFVCLRGGEASRMCPVFCLKRTFRLGWTLQAVAEGLCPFGCYEERALAF